MKECEGLVSVIIPTYNCEDYITQCVESIENQTYSNIEIIMCDDCSTDNTRKVISELVKKYNNITVIYNEKNLKAAETRNRCMAKAKGEFVAIQDADDYSTLDRIEKEVDFLNNNKELDYVSASAMIVEDNKICGKRIFTEKVIEDKDFCMGLPIIHGATLLRKTAIDKVNGYRVDKMTVRGQDYDMFFRMQINNIKGYRLSECLYYYREDDVTYKRRKFKYRITDYKMRKTYYKQMNLNFFQRLYRFRPFIAGVIPIPLLKLRRRLKEKRKSSISGKIKVAQVLRGMDVGGIETFLMNLCKTMDNSKVQVDFIYFDAKPNFYDEEIKKMGLEIYYVPKNKNVFKHICDLKRKFKEEKYDVVHVHSLWYNGVVMFAAWLAKIKIRISHSHSTSDGKKKSISRILYQKISKVLIRVFSNRFCACGVEAGKYLYYNTEKMQNKVIILKNGIDVNCFRNIDNKNVKKEFNLNNTDVVLGNVSRFEPVKNHKFMLAIAKELVNRNLNFKMILVGDGSLMDEVKKQIIQEKLEDYIVLPGKRTDIPQILSALDVFLLPSKYEGFPFVTVEAQATGIQLILTKNIDRNTSINEELVNYIDINDSDVPLWCDKIELLCKDLEKDKDNKKEIQVIIEKGYDINRTVENIINIYCDK